MKEFPSDDELRNAYRPFAHAHDRRREELLEVIAKIDVTPKGTRVQRKRRWPAGIVLSLAAILLVGVTLAVAIWSTAGSSAAAVEQVRVRLLGIRSLYLKGWRYQTVEKNGELVVERFPLEFYSERPSRYWASYYVFSYERERKLTNVSHGYTARDGERTISVAHNERRAVIEPAGRLETELFIERHLQATIFDQLVAGLPESYRHVGTEDVQGLACDVYECHAQSKVGFRHRGRLWLDKRNGMPVRIKGWSTFKTREEPDYEYHTVRIDGPPREGMFSFEAPEGYQVNVIKGEAKPISLPEGPSSSGGGLRFYTWIPFSIDDRAVLYCWSVETRVGRDNVLQRMPEFLLGRPGEERPCRHVRLPSDTKWNWSLFLPQREGDRIGLDDELAMVVKEAGVHSQSGGRPLRLPPEQLDRILLEAQRSTIPAGSGIEPLTVQKIREVLDTARHAIELEE